jgi:hypothetical protein
MEGRKIDPYMIIKLPYMESSASLILLIYLFNLASKDNPMFFSKYYDIWA